MERNAAMSRTGLDLAQWLDRCARHRSGSCPNQSCTIRITKGRVGIRYRDDLQYSWSVHATCLQCNDSWNMCLECARSGRMKSIKQIQQHQSFHLLKQGLARTRTSRLKPRRIVTDVVVGHNKQKNNNNNNNTKPTCLRTEGGDSSLLRAPKKARHHKTPPLGTNPSRQTHNDSDRNDAQADGAIQTMLLKEREPHLKVSQPHPVTFGHQMTPPFTFDLPKSPSMSVIIGRPLEQDQEEVLDDNAMSEAVPATTPVEDFVRHKRLPEFAREYAMWECTRTGWGVHHCVARSLRIPSSTAHTLPQADVSLQLLIATLCQQLPGSQRLQLAKIFHTIVKRTNCSAENNGNRTTQSSSGLEGTNRLQSQRSAVAADTSTGNESPLVCRRIFHNVEKKHGATTEGVGRSDSNLGDPTHTLALPTTMQEVRAR